MLDTLLEIGRKLREAPDGLKHHRYVKSAPLPTKDNPVKFWTVPVNPDGSFDFDERQPLEDETKQRALFYLNYKTSDADSLKKYIFGDIYYTLTKTGEDGNWKFGDPKSGAAAFRVNSLLRGDSDSETFESEWLTTFRKSLHAQLEEIEAFIRDQRNVYIHFDCDGCDWHTRPEFATYNTKMLGSFGRETPHGYVLDAALYKTISVGNSSTAGFGHDGDKSFRNRTFATQDDLLDLIYAVNISNRSAIRKGDVKVIVLPRGEGLSADDIERFFRLKSLKSAQDDEEKIAAQTPDVVSDVDELFAPIEADAARNVAQFDFIFSKASSSPSSPDADMIEISGLERSKLSHIAARVRRIKSDVEAQRAQFFLKAKKQPSPMSIAGSFSSLLGDMTRAKKKYQSHLFSVLPQIYTETYFRDPVLLPALIEKTEFYLREGSNFWNFLRFDFLFLTKIQIEGDETYKKMLNTPSYKIGYLLGKYAKQFSGSDSPVKSFEKNYAGLFSRRVTRIEDVRAFQNKVTQMLIMHKGAKRGKFTVFFPYEVQQQLTDAVKNFSGAFDRDFCAYGFFEGYFEHYSSKEQKEAEEPDADNVPDPAPQTELAFDN